MNVTWDLVKKAQAFPPAVGMFVRVTFDIPSDECKPASITTDIISMLTSYIPWVGGIVAYQFSKSADEIVSRNEGYGVVARAYLPIAGVGIAFNEVDSKRPTLSIAKGPFSDFVVEMLDGHDYRGLDESGRQRLIVDLNMGAGGKFLYLKCEPHQDGGAQPISKISILSSKKDNIGTPAGFTRVPMDLNKSVGGDFIYLFYKRGEPVIDALAVIAGDNNGISAPDGFSRIDVDLNRGARGKFIYLCYQSSPTVIGHAPEPTEHHLLTPGERCHCGQVHRKLPPHTQPL